MHDQPTQDSQPQVAPTQPFTPPTLAPPIKHSKAKRTTLLVCLLVILLIVGGLAAWQYHQQKGTTHPATSQQSTAKQASTASTGTDNSSLQSDLNDLDSANAQDNSNLTTTNTSLNDKQQEIAVPTN